MSEPLLFVFSDSDPELPTVRLQMDSDEVEELRDMLITLSALAFIHPDVEARAVRMKALLDDALRQIPRDAVR